MYKVNYIYDDPSPAGPFRGSSEVKDKYAKGDMIWGMFGRGTVVSCRLIKAKKIVLTNSNG